MRSQGMTVGWAVALVVGSAVIATGSVYAITGAGSAAVTTGARGAFNAGSRDGGQPAGSVGRRLDMTEMRNVLVPQAEQPPAQQFRGPMTLKQATAEGILGVPPELAYDPATCGAYLTGVLGELSELDGWVQFGRRVEQDHNNDFLQLVVALPESADQTLINRIRRAVGSCTSGTVMVEGKVAGRVTTIEQGALNEPDAVSFAFTRKMSFDLVPGARDYDFITGYRLPPDDRSLVNDELYHLTQTNIVGIGQALIVVAEANLLTSNEIARKMARSARNALVGR